MTETVCRAGKFQRTLCWTLALVIAVSPSVSALAQTNAAAMSVRQRFEGTSPETPQPPGAPGAVPGQPNSAAVVPGKLDTRYVIPTSAAVVVIRPAQILASPLAQAFPVEVVSAAGMKYLGFEPTEMEEIVACGEVSNLASPGYGVTFKFKNPIRATSIPVEARAHAQLAELGGKKYLRSAAPTMYSLYGPNNKTLVAATDAALRQLVENASQPKSGPMMDRIREVPSGSELYVAVDVASLRPLIPIGLAQMQMAGKVTPEAKQGMEMLNMISAIELTLNVSAPGPTSLVIHFADEAAAQKAEMLMQESVQKLRTSPQTEQPGGSDPIAQGMDRYKERLLQVVQPQRNGNSISVIHVDGQNPAQQQLVAVAIIGAATTVALPAIKKAFAEAAKAQPAPGPGGLPEGAAPPGSP